MAAAFEQITANGFTGTSWALAYGSNNKAGSLLLAAFFNNGTIGPTSPITDSLGNVWSQVDAQLTGVIYTTMWMAPKCLPGANTVTVGWASSVSGDLYIAEYSGVNISSPRDGFSDNTGSTTGAGSATSGSYTSITAGDLQVYFAHSSGSLAVGTGFNSRSTFDGNIWQDKLTVASGSQNPAANNNSGTWYAIAANFILATSGFTPTGWQSPTGGPSLRL